MTGLTFPHYRKKTQFTWASSYQVKTVTRKFYVLLPLQKSNIKSNPEIYLSFLLHSSYFSSSIAPKSPPEKTRYDTSLGLLTKKFVDLLAQSSDGVLDLNLAAETLQVISDQTEKKLMVYRKRKGALVHAFPF